MKKKPLLYPLLYRTHFATVSAQPEQLTEFSDPIERYKLSAIRSDVCAGSVRIYPDRSGQIMAVGF